MSATEPVSGLSFIHRARSLLNLCSTASFLSGKLMGAFHMVGSRDLLFSVKVNTYLFFNFYQNHTCKHSNYRSPKHNPGVRNCKLILNNFPNIYYAHQTNSYPKTNTPLELSFAFVNSYHYLLIIITAKSEMLNQMLRRLLHLIWLQIDNINCTQLNSSKPFLN